MRLKPLVIVVGILATVISGVAQRAEARGFGSRGGISVSIGIGRTPVSNRRYLGPGFYLAPRINGSFRQGSAQFQLRPWTYDRLGPIESYRPYNPPYRRR